MASPRPGCQPRAVGFATLLGLAVGLAMDAMAVSATRGLMVERLEWRHALAVGLVFGGFQALMPALGWLLGAQLGPWLEHLAHWLAFGLLTTLAAKMAWDARRSDEAEAAPARPFAPTTMLLLGVATSLDALAAGISLPMLDVPHLHASLVIGLVTAALSVLGLFAGRRFGAALGGRLAWTGALVLFAIGLKILLEGLV